MTRRRTWFRAACWVISYLLYFDTLTMSGLQFAEGSSRAAEVEGSGWVGLADEGAAASGSKEVLGSGRAAASGPLHVSKGDPTCGGSSPCFRTIQAAIDAVEPGGRVLVHAGQYDEALRIFGKNSHAGATEAERIVIEADPEARPGSVVIGSPGGRCARGTAVRIEDSSFVTFRGFVLRDAGGKGIVLRGRRNANQAVHIERNRIFSSGSRACSGGVSILRANSNAVVANNLIYANGRQGIYVADVTGGPHYLVSNTVVGNGWDGIFLARAQVVHLLNNLIAGNGVERSRRGGRFGVRRRGTSVAPEGAQLERNLICGNALGELKGRVLDASDEGNLTPTGTEGPGVLASAGCGVLTALFADLAGEDGEIGTADDDFRLAADSPALDRGAALVARLSGIDPEVLRADHFRRDVRPADGDGDQRADYDIGAVEEGGGDDPTPTPTPSPTPTPTPTATPSPTPTPTPTATPSPTPTPSPTFPPIVTPTPTPVPTEVPTPSPEPSPTGEPVPCLMCDACDTGIPGICSAGRTFCDGPFAQPECRTTVEPRTESCGNAIDEDCDGVVDEGGVPAELPTAPPGTGVFVEPLGSTVKFFNQGSAIGLAQGDFNQDGRVDIATAEDANVHNGRRVSVIFGNGNGTFSEPTYLALAPQHVIPQSVLAHDFDRDGALDLLVAMRELHEVYFYRGDGSGGFAAPVPSSVAGLAHQIQAADLNCDGILDVATIVDATHVTVGFGNGDGSFAPTTSYTFSNNLVDLALTDVNGDGHPDLVTGSHEFAPLTGIGVRLNDGAGQFGDLKHTAGYTLPDQFGNRGNVQVFGIQIADYDGDTVADAVASTQGPTGCFTFMKGNGDGTFALPDYFDGLAERDPSWTCVGSGNLMRRYTENVAPDVDADGKPDVLFYWDENRVVVGIGRGDGTFEARAFAASASSGFPGSQTYQRADGSGMLAAIVADVNGDCMLDMVTNHRQTNGAHGRQGVLLARAPGDFHAPRIAPLLRDPTGDNGHQMERGVVTGDFDNDGNPDFAAGVGRAFFTVGGAGIGIDIWKGNGDGRGEALPITLNNYGGTGSSYLRTADFDQDGFLDFVFQGGDGPFGRRQSVSTVFGEGDFTFIDRTAAYSPRLDADEVNIRNMITADLDGDDDPDVVALYDNGGFTKWFATFLNTGTRAPLQFVSEVQVGQGSNGRGIVAADFDGDDIPDLVAQDSGFSNPQLVRLFKGNGDLTFEPGVTIFEWTNQGAAAAEDFAAADLDEDGDQDLVMAQYHHPCAYVFLGHDDGTFDAPVCYPFWTSRTNRLAIDDFDVDGSLDIVAGVEDGGLMFLRGRGDGKFETTQMFAVGRANTEAVNVADFDRDGRPDLLWSYNDANFGHSIILSNPTGAVPTPTPAPTATLPPGVTHTPAPTPTPTPSPRVTPPPPEDLAEIVVEPVDQILLANETQQFTATGVFADGTSTDLTADVAWSSGTPSVAAITSSGGLATGSSAGTTTITAAIGPFSGSTTLTVGARVSDANDPTVAITSPAANAEVTEPIDVIGTATDANFLKYELEIAPVGETTFTLLERGGAPVSNGTLGQLDPTLLVNGPYVVRLTVFDRGGNTAETSVVYVIAREKKVGLFTVSFTDLNVELAGIPITLTRTYDSRDKGKGDFGVGWRLAIRTLQLRTNRVLGTGWTTQNAGISVQLVALDQHYATVTLPDGKVETFDLMLSPTSQPFSLDATNVVGFAPRPGTLGTLEGLDNGSLLVVQGGDEVELWDDLTFQTYNPRRFRYTTSSGEKIVIDRVNGVESVTDSNGNALTIGALGITHSSGKNVAFLRDAEGRIAQITDPAGVTQQYAYDAAGDLISHTGAVGNTTTFKYNRFHGLLDIFDPTGARVARNEYDESGRLIATTDGQGHRTELDHDLGGSQEVIRDRLGNETVYTYDAVGNVTSKVDALGGLTTYSHDGRGNLLTETDPLGRVATKTYDAANNVLTSTDFDGNTTTKTYDARGKVLTTTDAEGRTTTNVYDAQGNLTQTTDPEGGVTNYTHDAQGNVLTQTDPIGRTTTFTYDAFGKKTSEANALGQVTTFSYNANGNVLTETLPGGQLVHFQYDPAQRLVGTGDGASHQGSTTYSNAGDGKKIASLENPGGESRSFEYNARGDLLETTHADGSTSTSTYDAEGRETSRTDRDGHTTLYDYDALGRQTKITHPDGSTIVKTYDAVGRLKTQRDERGNTTTYAYAPNQQTVTDALGNATVHEFDSRARRIKMTDALGRATTFTYDSRGEPVETRFPDGTTKTVGYDLAGQKTSETDQAGETTTFTYDDAGNLESVTSAAGETTSYTYDARGNRISETDGNGHTTALEYDLLDRLTKRTRPLGQFETFTYDLNGNVATHTDFEGKTTSFGYDGDSRQISKTLPNSTVVPYAYSSEGLRTLAGGDSFEYDSRGRLIEETKASGEILSYGYDVAGNRTSLTTPQGTTTYTYDALNRLESVSDATGTTTYSYDDVGNLAETAFPNGVTTTYEYDDLNRLEKMTNGGPGGLMSSYTYTLGAAGNRLGVTEFGPATTGRVVTYDYDDVYRLVRETIDDAGTADDQAIAYGYDSVGNRTEIDRDGVITTLLYDDNDRLTSETTGAITTSYTYGDNGNLQLRTTGATTDTYAYDAEDRLTGATLQSGPNPGTVVYGYDADGMRISATANGTTTSFLLDKNRDHAQVLVETRGPDSVVYSYGHDLISQTRPGNGTRFYQYDGQLSTRQLTNTAGVATDSYTFDAFGVLLASTGSSPNAYLYGGEQLDPNVGFYYLRARYYDQTTGRFLTTDPEEGSVFDPVSLHRYLYANADPVNNSDPSGRLTIPEIAIVSVLVGTIAGIVTFAVTKSIRFAIFVGATVAASTFLVLYFFGGVTLAWGGEGFAVREAIQEAVRSGTVIRTVRVGGRVLGCAVLLIVRGLLKLPVEELFLHGGLGLPPGTPIEAMDGVRRNLQMVRRELDATFGRTGIGCPRTIRVP